MQCIDCVTHKRAWTLVWILAVVHAAAFFAFGVDRYLAHTTLVDFGLFTQVAASAFSGFSSTFEGTTHWAFHFSPIVYVCGPLVLLAHSGLALTAIQSIAVALALPPVYLIAYRRAGAKRALAIAGAAALYPALAGVDFSDFHENGFAPAATLWLLWALDARCWRYAYACLAVILSIKEDEALILLFLAAVSFFVFRARDDRMGMRFSIVAACAAVICFVGYFSLIRPSVDPLHHWQPTRFYAWKMSDVQTLGLQTLGDRLGYLALAFAPLAFIPLRSRVVVFALPGFAECLLSREHATYTMGQHYAAVWVPYVLAAFAVAASRLPSMRPMGLCALLCVLTYLVANPLHPGYFLRIPQERDRRLDAYLATLPPDISVGTQEEAYTHLGFDPHAQLGVANLPEYVLLDRDFPESVWLAWMDPVLKRARVAGTYRLIDRANGVEFYRRVVMAEQTSCTNSSSFSRIAAHTLGAAHGSQRVVCMR
jgi:uncharacterized membrane protein